MNAARLNRSRLLLAFIREFGLPPNWRMLAIIGRMRGLWSKTTRTCDAELSLRRTWAKREWIDNAEREWPKNANRRQCSLIARHEKAA